MIQTFGAYKPACLGCSSVTVLTFETLLLTICTTVLFRVPKMISTACWTELRLMSIK